MGLGKNVLSEEEEEAKVNFSLFFFVEQIVTVTILIKQFRNVHLML
jgi:hypothetical protein